MNAAETSSSDLPEQASPPQKTIVFALDAEQKLRQAWLRRAKKTGEKGSVASASDLASMMISSGGNSTAQNNEASAEMSASLDDFLNDFDVFEGDTNDIKNVLEANKYQCDTPVGSDIAPETPAKKPPSLDAFDALDDFLT